MNERMTLAEWVLAPFPGGEEKPLTEEDMRLPFERLLRETAGIAGGLENGTSPTLQKALDDERSLARQFHEDIGDIIEHFVDFDRKPPTWR